MSALEKIIEEILSQANDQADGIISEARQKAALILENAKAVREEWQRQVDEAYELECRDIFIRTESAVRQNRRRALLEMRNHAVDEVIAESKAQIIHLPDNEYFDFLFRLFEKNAQPLDGTIRFAPFDYARMPDGFLERCRRVFPDHDLELSGAIEGIGNGFVIEYGDILQNCLIDNIFETDGQRLRDKAYEVLSTDANEV